MSEMFEGVDTETLRTLHRQFSDKAIAVYQEAAGLIIEDPVYAELMGYGHQVAGAARLVSTELDVRHQVKMAELDQQIAELHKLNGCTCGEIGATGSHFAGCIWSAR
jgi:hypothetical protein